jgi:hypothetical protein
MAGLASSMSFQAQATHFRCGEPPQRAFMAGGVKVPWLQILTAAQIVDNRRPQLPFGFTEGFKKAGR